MRPLAKTERQGFTAIEVLVGVAIILILTALSASVFNGLSNSQSLEKDVASTLSTIEKARTMSLNSVDGTTHGVKFQESRISIFPGIEFETGSTESYYDLPTGSSVSDIDLSNSTTTLYFAKLTGKPSATGEVTITRKGESKTIVIYGTGVAEVQ